MDREQRVLGNTGVELRRVSPTLTEQERSAIDARRRQDQAEQARVREERSRDRAMLLRYPNQASHDAARNEALSQVSDVNAVAQQRLSELKQRRTKLNTELEFYQNDPKKAPANLRRQLKDNSESQEEQLRFIKQQDEEQQRINQRFDAELQQLRRLWGQAQALLSRAERCHSNGLCRAMTRPSSKAAAQASPPTIRGICVSSEACAISSSASARHSAP